MPVTDMAGLIRSTIGEFRHSARRAHQSRTAGSRSVRRRRRGGPGARARHAAVATHSRSAAARRRLGRGARFRQCAARDRDRDAALHLAARRPVARCAGRPRRCARRSRRRAGGSVAVSAARGRPRRRVRVCRSSRPRFARGAIAACRNARAGSPPRIMPRPSCSGIPPVGDLSLQKIRSLWQNVHARAGSAKVTLRRALAQTSVHAFDGDVTDVAVAAPYQRRNPQGQHGALRAAFDGVFGRSLEMRISVENGRSSPPAAEQIR